MMKHHGGKEGRAAQLPKKICHIIILFAHLFFFVHKPYYHVHNTGKGLFTLKNECPNLSTTPLDIQHHPFYDDYDLMMCILNCVHCNFS